MISKVYIGIAIAAGVLGVGIANNQASAAEVISFSSSDATKLCSVMSLPLGSFNKVDRDNATDVFCGTSSEANIEAHIKPAKLEGDNLSYAGTFKGRNIAGLLYHGSVLIVMNPRTSEVNVEKLVVEMNDLLVVNSAVKQGEPKLRSSESFALKIGSWLDDVKEKF